MFNIENYLRSCPAEQVICVETGATKKMVLAAITGGAKTFAEVAKSVELMRDGDSVRNVETLLKIYAPVFGLMSAGGGCHGHCGQKGQTEKV